MRFKVHEAFALSMGTSSRLVKALVRTLGFWLANPGRCLRYTSAGLANCTNLLVQALRCAINALEGPRGEYLSRHATSKLCCSNIACGLLQQYDWSPAAVQSYRDPQDAGGPDCVKQAIRRGSATACITLSAKLCLLGLHS